MGWTNIPGVGKLRSSILSSLITELRPVFARKTTDEIVSNSTTVQNDDELFVPMVANATYLTIVNIIYTAGTVADYKWAITFPAGCTFSPLAHEKDTALAYAQALSDNYPSGTTVATGGAGIGTLTGLTLFGAIVVGSTAGNFQYQWAQNTATVENTATKAGSMIFLARTA